MSEDNMTHKARAVGLLRLTVLPLVDTALFNLAFILAYWIRMQFLQEPWLDSYIELMWFTWLLPPIIFSLVGMYRSWYPHAFVKGVDIVLSGTLLTMSVLLVVIWSVRGRLMALQTVETLHPLTDVADLDLVWGFPSSVFLMALCFSPLFIWLWRIIANMLERSLLGWSTRPRNLVFVGLLSDVDITRLQHNRYPPFNILGYFNPTQDDTISLPWLGSPEALESYLGENDVDEAWITAYAHERGILLSAISACFTHDTRPRLVPGVYEALVGAASPRIQGDLGLYTFRNAGISGWPLVAKRILDVVAAFLMLLITTPLFIIPACIAIVIESKGFPVFSQIRVGVGGRHFKLYKLRTMVIDADIKGGPLTADADPRITKVGQFLRRTSIDELPQLLNVLTGDMSMVGPRAVVPFVADKFQPWEQISLSVRPGVTGLAQVSGRDEIGFREKSLLNLYYVRNYSFWLDLRILFDTVGTVLSMEGTAGTRVK